MLKDKKGKDVDKVYRLKYQLCFCFTSYWLADPTGNKNTAFFLDAKW